MEEKYEIINLLQSKQTLTKQLNDLIYGSVEIREKDSNKYIYVHYREDGILLTKYVGEYSDNLYNLILNNSIKAKQIKKENIKFVHYVFALLIAVGLLFFALLPNYGITLLFEKIGSKATAVVPTLDKPADYVLCTLIICILPAIGEELIFRKAFCDGLSDVADVKVILLCGIAFSLSHLNLAQTVHQFILGCCLGFAYVKTKNITLTAFMHFLNNAMALFIERITGAEIWNNIVVLAVSCAVGFVVMAAGFFGLIKKTNKLNNDKKGKLEPITAVFIGVLAVAWMICAVLSFY